jgi:hypothetical protein
MFGITDPACEIPHGSDTRNPAHHSKFKVGEFSKKTFTLRWGAKPSFEKLLRVLLHLLVLTNQSEKKRLAGVDLCCDLLDFGLGDLNPSGGVDGLDCLEEIAGDLARDDPGKERV